MNKYLDSWLSSGMISQELHAALSADYKKQQSQNRSRLFIYVLSSIGAILLGIGVILLFAMNWQSLGSLVRAFLILLLPIFPLVIGHYFAYMRKSLPVFGRSLISLGALCIGASIGLFIQTYHLSPDFFLSLVIWLACLTPLVFLYRFSLLVFFHAILLIATLNVGIFELSSSYWYYFDELNILVFANFFLGASLLGLGIFFRSLRNVFPQLSSVYRGVGLNLMLITGWFATISSISEELFGDRVFMVLSHIAYLVLLGAVIFFSISRQSSAMLRKGFMW